MWMNGVKICSPAFLVLPLSPKLHVVSLMECLGISGGLSLSLLFRAWLCHGILGALQDWILMLCLRFSH